MVTDGNTDASVKFANVVLQTLDSTFIIGVSTDTKGRFQLEKIETGSYRLIISAIGYTDNITDLNGLSKSVVKAPFLYNLLLIVYLLPY